MASTNNYRVSKSARRTLTCDMCKARHQKCNGAQPQCNNCELRSIGCTYNNTRIQAPARTQDSPELASPILATSRVELNSRQSISGNDYDRLYAQIFGDIVKRLNLRGGDNPGVHEEVTVDSQRPNASLPSLYRDVSTMVKELIASDSQPTTSRTASNIPPPNQARDPALERDLNHSRKLLRDSLPSIHVSRRLLDLFFQYQNSIFFVCKRDEAQEQLDLMYEDPDQVKISWYCQMFLIFAVGIQFDDMDDTDGETYHEIGLRHIDDAMEEDPQNTLWVMRAMLLLCFYPPPTKWTSIWLYFDAAIRGAHRFQLDLGHNTLKELSNEEYEEWRQLWFTIISFDRWVAIFLGRLPRIKESISRDAIFKHMNVDSGVDGCTVQNNVTSLAIISGYILRDMYFSQKFSLSICQQRRKELEAWMSNLPSPLRQSVESGVLANMSEDETEAAFNLHFMQLGAWMLLTRPSLMKVVKSGTSATSFASPIVSAITSDAILWTDFISTSSTDSASRLIKSATTLLAVSLAPKRSFMSLFFLVNAAHIIILGALWKLKQSNPGPGSLTSCDISQELATVDTSIKVLDFCGQRNMFARKYSALLKNLRNQLSKSQPNQVRDMISGTNALSLAPFTTSPNGNFNTPGYSNTTAESQNFQSPHSSAELSSLSMTPLLSSEGTTDYQDSFSFNSSRIRLWSEQTPNLYPANESYPNDLLSGLQNSNDFEFLDTLLE